MKNLQELPRFADKLSYLYVEHAAIERCDKAVAIHQADGTTQVPAAALGVLLLGPGTKITHAAVAALADNNCQIIWMGEHAVRFYAHGLGGARHSRNLIRQARLVSNDLTRLQVVIRMYALRFDESVVPSVTLQQLRGMEGVRVRQAYAQAAKTFGVVWQGRNYKREQWDHADPLNRALSAANSCLYGLCQAAILSAGYSPALGFIHTGKQLSFVYDVADLYKTQYSIPISFGVAAAGPTQLEREVRVACRDAFRRDRLMERILPDIQTCLDVPEAGADDEYAEDASRPAALWEPRTLRNDVPIGEVLKLDLSRLPGRGKEKRDGSDGAGEGARLPAG